jgi:hypothetical protein
MTGRFITLEGMDCCAESNAAFAAKKSDSLFLLIIIKFFIYLWINCWFH